MNLRSLKVLSLYIGHWEEEQGIDANETQVRIQKNVQVSRRLVKQGNLKY